MLERPKFVEVSRCTYPSFFTNWRTEILAGTYVYPFVFHDSEDELDEWDDEPAEADGENEEM
jgi:hypothetical protein